MGKKSSEFFFDLYESEIFQSNERKATFNYGKGESWPMNPFPDWSQFVDPEPLEWRDDYVYLGEYLKVLLLAFPQKIDGS